MDKITCNARIENGNIIISDLKNDAIEIDLSGDVDFTGLVSILSEFIDISTEIELKIKDEDTIEDEKLKLIVKTLKNIFDKYKMSINETAEIKDKDDIDTEKSWVQTTNPQPKHQNKYPPGICIFYNHIFKKKQGEINDDTKL